MSDQEFKGCNPKSEVGKSIYFHSMDWWLELRDRIQMFLGEDIPVYMQFDAENAEYLADLLQQRLHFGIVRAYYELTAKQRGRGNASPEEDADASEGDADNIATEVETMMSWTRRYIDFLKNSGGCEPAEVGRFRRKRTERCANSRCL